MLRSIEPVVSMRITMSARLEVGNCRRSHLRSSPLRYQSVTLMFLPGS